MARRKHELLSATMLEAVAARFRALAEPARLRLMQALFDGERSVQDLAEATGLSQANASKHLGVLSAAGLLRRRKEGVRVVYGLTDETPRQLCDLVCAGVRRSAEETLRRTRARAGEPSA